MLNGRSNTNRHFRRINFICVLIFFCNVKIGSQLARSEDLDPNIEKRVWYEEFVFYFIDRLKKKSNDA